MQYGESDFGELGFPIWLKLRQNMNFQELLNEQEKK